MRALRRRTSSALRTNDIATRSASSARPDRSSSSSREVRAGMGSAASGRLTPLPDETVPGTTTSRTGRSPASTTTSSTAPSSIRTRWPTARCPSRSGNVTGRSPPSPTLTLCLRDSSTGPASSPRRSLGPGRSTITPISRPAACAAARTAAMAARCSSGHPCDRLTRATSIPSATSAATTPGPAVAGPSVTTIFVLRIAPATHAVLATEPVTASLRQLGQRGVGGLARARAGADGDRLRERLPCLLVETGREGAKYSAPWSIRL